MTPERPLATILDELWHHGVLQRSGERFETTRRWRAARHRASSAREPASELNVARNPIVQALREFYRNQVGDSLAPYVAVLFALESSERSPRGTPPQGAR